MKDKHDILSKRIRERLKDFEQPVPDHIWSAIEEDLVPTISISQTKKLWRNISIAASFLLIASVGSLLFLNVGGNDGQVVDGNKTKVETPVTQSNQQPLLADNNSQDDITSETQGNSHPQKVFISRSSGSQAIAEQPNNAGNVKPENPVTQTVSGTSSTSKENKPEEKSQQSQPDPKTSSFYTDALANDNVLNNVSIKPKKKSGISYALAVGNTNNGYKGGNNETTFLPSMEQSYYMQSAPGSSKNFFYQIDAKSTDNNATTPADYKHDLPISVGFTVRKQISDKFALESGLVYTHLSSEGKITSVNPITNNISLNYLGIPVKAVYSLYDNNRVSVYATAGGMVEKSVSGTFKSTINDEVESKNLNVKEMQYSLTGAAGVNVRLAGHLGLFIEPGVAYYFDDKSGVATIRKDRPFNFNLQGGLRLSY